MLSLTHLLLAVVALAAMGQQLFLHIAASYDVLNFFSYFTNLSNLFAALVLLLSVFSGKGSSLDVVRYVSTVNMAVVGIVFAVLLRNVDLGALLPWVNFVLHYVMPLAIVLLWFMTPPTTRLTSKHLLLALIFPAAYLAYTIIRGASLGWYPYPFLNPANVGGYGMVAAYSLGITATFIVVSWALLVTGNRLGRSKAPAIRSTR